MPIPKVGDIMVCPSCGPEFPLEEWQIKDGPCADGKFYCLRVSCHCGCPHGPQPAPKGSRLARRPGCHGGKR